MWYDGARMQAASENMASSQIVTIFTADHANVQDLVKDEHQDQNNPNMEV